MRRRELICLIGGAAVAWPLAARAQQADRMRRVGVLEARAADDREGQARLAAFLQGLQELGWTDGRNLRIDYRWAAADADRSRTYAAELVALAPDVILASASQSTAALLQTTRTVPIVFVNVVDPVGAGFVARLARPGGNATGFTPFEYSLSGKWLELLKEIAPNLTRIAILRDPAIATGIGQFAAIQAMASPSLGVELSPIDVRDGGKIERDIVALAREFEWRPDRDGKFGGGGPSRTNHHACGSAPVACGLPLPLLRHQRRTDLLRAGSDRSISASGGLRRPHPQRREGGRPAGAVTDQVRIGDQSQDRECARSHHAAVAARTSRSGDRIEMLFAAVHEFLYVQVFGRRDDGLTTRRGGRRPKSAKARNRGGCGTRRCSRLYGDCMSALWTASGREAATRMAERFHNFRVSA